MAMRKFTVNDLAGSAGTPIRDFKAEEQLKKQELDQGLREAIMRMASLSADRSSREKVSGLDRTSREGQNEAQRALMKYLQQDQQGFTAGENQANRSQTRFLADRAQGTQLDIANAGFRDRALGRQQAGYQFDKTFAQADKANDATSKYRQTTLDQQGERDTATEKFRMEQVLSQRSANELTAAHRSAELKLKKEGIDLQKKQYASQAEQQNAEELRGALSGYLTKLPKWDLDGEADFDEIKSLKNMLRNETNKNFIKAGTTLLTQMQEQLDKDEASGAGRFNKNLRGGIETYGKAIDKVIDNAFDGKDPFEGTLFADPGRKESALRKGVGGSPPSALQKRAGEAGSSFARGVVDFFGGGKNPPGPSTFQTDEVSPGDGGFSRVPPVIQAELSPGDGGFDRQEDALIAKLPPEQAQIVLELEKTHPDLADLLLEQMLAAPPSQGMEVPTAAAQPSVGPPPVPTASAPVGPQGEASFDPQGLPPQVLDEVMNALTSGDVDKAEAILNFLRTQQPPGPGPAGPQLPPGLFDRVR